VVDRSLRRRVRRHRVGRQASHLRRVGPTLQFGSIDYDYDDPVLGHVSINDDGFGTGYYSRIGIEFTISPGMAIGASYRYVDSNIDFGGQISDMDLKQDQYMLTCTQSF